MPKIKGDDKSLVSGMRQLTIRKQSRRVLARVAETLRILGYRRRTRTEMKHRA